MLRRSPVPGRLRDTWNSLPPDRQYDSASSVMVRGIRGGLRPAAAVRIEPFAVAETGVSAGPAESGPVAGLPGSRGLPILGRNPLTGILSPKRTTATRPMSEGLRVPCGQVPADRVSCRDGYRTGVGTPLRAGMRRGGSADPSGEANDLGRPDGAPDDGFKPAGPSRRAAPARVPPAVGGRAVNLDHPGGGCQAALVQFQAVMTGTPTIRATVIMFSVMRLLLRGEWPPGQLLRGPQIGPGLGGGYTTLPPVAGRHRAPTGGRPGSGLAWCLRWPQPPQQPT
jgi:hypothetical protein